MEFLEIKKKEDKESDSEYIVNRYIYYISLYVSKLYVKYRTLTIIWAPEWVLKKVDTAAVRLENA